jgi:hypothetical protein
MHRPPSAGCRLRGYALTGDGLRPAGYGSPARDGRWRSKLGRLHSGYRTGHGSTSRLVEQSDEAADALSRPRGNGGVGRGRLVLAHRRAPAPQLILRVRPTRVEGG